MKNINNFDTAQLADNENGNNFHVMIYDFPKPFLVVLLLLITGLLPATAQSPRVDGGNPPDLSSYFREKHGLDQELINGTIYYNKYLRVRNHPYYIGEESHPGSVILSGIRYNDVQINYDIYSQYLVLEYNGVSGAPNKIILNSEQTDAFHLDENYFEKLSLDVKGPLFYQIISVNGITCYVHWEKIIMTLSYQYEDYFTDPKQSYFLDYFGKLSPFTNRKNFASLCTGVPKKKIKKYMQGNGIQLSDTTPEQLEGLLRFISSNLQSTSGN